MRAEFNNLVELMNRYDLYQKDDEVGIALTELEQKITEVEKRIECARRSNQDSNSVIMSLVTSYQDLGKTKEELTYGDFETLQRGVYDVDIALNFNDKEPIENDWYGLFVKVKDEVSSGGIPYKHCAECNIKEEEIVMTKMPNGVHLCCDCKEEPPTYQCRNTHTFDKVKEVIQILQSLDNGDCVDGETMEYILEQVGMSEQMLRQLARKDPKETMEIIAE